MRQRYRLLQDEVSCFHDKKGKPIVYGRTDDVVVEVARRGDILAVERPDGFRYSININKLSELK